MKGLGLCHESARSAWAINIGDAYGPITAAQLRYIEGSLKGLGLCQDINKRRAVVAQLIRDGLEGKVTTEEMEENKNSVASGKAGMQTHNFNSWVIKEQSGEQSVEIFEYGSQEACELKQLSTKNVFKFLKASNVSTSKDTVIRSTRAKIEDGTSVGYSVLLLGKKKIASGICVKLLSSVKNGKSIKVG